MKITKVPPLTPRDCLSARPSRAVHATTGDESIAVWEELVPRVVHPIKVAIIEALLWIGEPLSATELTSSFGKREYYLGLIRHHANALTDLGALEIVGRRPVRGATEVFYFFPERR